MNTESLKKLSRNLELAFAFNTKYSDALEKVDGVFLTAGEDYATLYLKTANAALAGTVFGKTGWTKHPQHNSYRGAIDWRKTVDGVVVIIDNAEQISVDGMPVAERDFPIMLEDSKPVEEVEPF